MFNEVHERPGHTANLIVLIVKQYLYRIQCLKHKLTIEGIKLEIKKVYKIEIIIARSEDKFEQYECKWQGKKYDPCTQLRKLITM